MKNVSAWIFTIINKLYEIWEVILSLYKYTKKQTENAWLTIGNTGSKPIHKYQKTYTWKSTM